MKKLGNAKQIRKAFQMIIILRLVLISGIKSPEVKRLSMKEAIVPGNS